MLCYVFECAVLYEGVDMIGQTWMQQHFAFLQVSLAGRIIDTHNSQLGFGGHT